MKIMENEKQARLEVKYGEEHKRGGNEKCTLQDLEYCDKTKIMENEKHTLQEVKYGEKH